MPAIAKNRGEPRGLQAATDLLQRRLRPAAILLFGSHAAGKTTSTSDVDIAVLLARPVPPPEELAAIRTELEDVVQSDVDLVVLDNASPILAMEILRRHRVLELSDPEALEAFVVRTLTDYFDLKIVRRPIEKALMRLDAK